MCTTTLLTVALTIAYCIPGCFIAIAYTEQHFGYYNLQWTLEVICFLIFYPLIFIITLIAAGLDYLDEKLR